MNLRKFLFIGATAAQFLAGAHAFAADSNVGTAGGAFLKLGAGCPRAQALGRAYVALADGPEAMGWNPAGIASSQLREIQFSYLDWFQGYKGGYVGYVHPLGQTVVGVNAAYFTIEDFDGRDSQGFAQGGTIQAQDGFTTVSVARALLVERLLVGGSIKGVLENNDDTRHTNLVFDAGVLLKLGKRLSLGWAVQNLGADKQDAAQLQRIGAAVNLNSYITLTGEVETSNDNNSRPGLGLELTLPEELLQVGRVQFRAGFFSSDSHGESLDDSFLKDLGLQKTSGISLGFGLYTAEVMGYGLAIDYALVPYGALGKTNQLSLSFQF